MVKNLKDEEEVRKRLEAKLINDYLGKGKSGAVYESKNIREEFRKHVSAARSN